MTRLELKRAVPKKRLPSPSKTSPLKTSSSTIHADTSVASPAAAHDSMGRIVVEDGLARMGGKATATLAAPAPSSFVPTFCSSAPSTQAVAGPVFAATAAAAAAGSAEAAAPVALGLSSPPGSSPSFGAKSASAPAFGPSAGNAFGFASSGGTSSPSSKPSVFDVTAAAAASASAAATTCAASGTCNLEAARLPEDKGFLELDRLILQAGNLLKPLYALQISLRCLPRVISPHRLLKGVQGESLDLPRTVLHLLEMAMLDATYQPVIKRSIVKLLSCKSQLGSDGLEGAGEGSTIGTALEFIKPLLDVDFSDTTQDCKLPPNPLIPTSRRARLRLAMQLLESLVDSPASARHLAKPPVFRLILRLVMHFTGTYRVDLCHIISRLIRTCPRDLPPEMDLYFAPIAEHCATRLAVPKATRNATTVSSKAPQCAARSAPAGGFGAFAGGGGFGAENPAEPVGPAFGLTVAASTAVAGALSGEREDLALHELAMEWNTRERAKDAGEETRAGSGLTPSAKRLGGRWAPRPRPPPKTQTPLPSVPESRDQPPEATESEGLPPAGVGMEEVSLADGPASTTAAPPSSAPQDSTAPSSGAAASIPSSLGGGGALGAQPAVVHSEFDGCVSGASTTGGAFGQPSAGGFGTATVAFDPSTVGAFGAKSAPAFGQTALAVPAFGGGGAAPLGASTGGAFEGGLGASTIGGAFDQPAAGGFGAATGAFDTSTGGGFGAPQEGGFGSGFGGGNAFGAEPARFLGGLGAITGGGFGAPRFGQPAAGGAFGAAAGGVFGQTGGGLGAPQAGGFGGGFGGGNAFGAKPTTAAFGAATGAVFGAPAAGGFGQPPAPGGFGAPNAATAPFGAATGSAVCAPAAGCFGQPAPGQGTVSVKWAKTTGPDGAPRSNTNSNGLYMAITAMPAYQNYSFDELRVQDYEAGGKKAIDTPQRPCVEDSDSGKKIIGTVAEAGVISERDPVFEVVLNQPLSAKSLKDSAAADVEVSLSLFEDEQRQGSEGSAWCDGGRCVVCVNGSGRIDLSSDCLSLRVGDTVKVACQGPLHVSGALGTIVGIAGGERAKVKLLQCRHQLMWGKCAGCFPGVQAVGATTGGSFGSASQASTKPAFGATAAAAMAAAATSAGATGGGFGIRAPATGGGFGAFGAAGTVIGFAAKPAGAFGAATGAAFGAPHAGGSGGAFGQAKPAAFGAPTETCGAAASVIESSVIELRVSDLCRVSASGKSVSQPGDRLAFAVTRPWNGTDMELAILVNGEVVQRMQYVPSGIRDACAVPSSSTAFARFFDSYAFVSLDAPSSVFFTSAPMPVSAVEASACEDLSAKAALTVSSAAHLAAKLLDGSLDTYWESQGSRPHWIQFDFPKSVTVQRVLLYMDNAKDDSFTPEKITVMVGSMPNELKQVSEFDNSQGLKTGFGASSTVASGT
jgi:hypothetical protein